MPAIHELPEEQTHRAYDVMLELRPEMGSKDDFVARVNGSLRPEGYRLVASFGDDDEVAAVAGFRTSHSLAWGHSPTSTTSSQRDPHAEKVMPARLWTGSMKKRQG